VEGAYTLSYRVFHPALRSTSTSSMQSAPAHRAATKVISLEAGLAEPDLIAGPTVASGISRSPACHGDQVSHLSGPATVGEIVTDSGVPQSRGHDG
jgi:hypothetical protein